MKKLVIIFIVIVASLGIIAQCSYQGAEYYKTESPSLRGSYSKEKEAVSNVILIISNQDFEKPSIQLFGRIDGEFLFDDVFEVGDQHVYSYYYLSLDLGDHDMHLTAPDGSELMINFSVKNQKQYYYVTCFYDDDHYELYLHYQGNTPPGLD